MAVGDIYTRKTIIPTSSTSGTKDKTQEAIQKVLQARGQKEQYSHYERQAVPIKERNLTTIKNQIAQKETEIKNKQEKINRYKEKERTSDRDYYWLVTEEEDEIRAIQKGLNSLKDELGKYEKITDPLEIVGYGDNYSSEVLRYANDVERYEERDARASRERQKAKLEYEKKALEERKKYEEEIKKQGGFIYQDIAFDKSGNVIGIVSDKGDKNYEQLMKEKSRLDKSAIVDPRGKGVFIEGKYMPSTNKEWAEKKKLEYDQSKFKVNLGPTVTLQAGAIPIKDGIRSQQTTQVVSTTPLRYENKTMEQLKISSPGRTDITEFKTREMTLSERKENEAFKELASIGYDNLLLLPTKQWWRKYDEKQRQEAIEMKYQERYEKIYKNNFLSKITTANKIYDTKSKDIIKRYENGDINQQQADSQLDQAYRDLENTINKVDEDWNKFADEDAKLQQRKIDASNFAAVWQMDSKKLANIAGTVAVAVGAGALLGPSTIGAYGSTGVKAASAAKAVGVGLTATSVGVMGYQAYNLYSQGRLNKYTALTLISEPIQYLGASIAGGIVGGKIGIARFKRIEAEFLLNIKSQAITDPKLQAKIFSSTNLNRGYAEIPYRGYTMRLGVNKRMAAQHKLMNEMLTQGTRVDRTTYGLNQAEKVVVTDAIKNKLGLSSNDIYISENGFAKIVTKTFTAKTGVQISGKTAYSVNGRMRGKYVEFIFNVKKNGRLTDLYVVTKSPTSVQDLYIAKIGKVIMSVRTKKIPITQGQPPAEILSINVKPVGYKLIYGKNIQQSIVQEGNVVLEKSISQIIIKDLKGAGLGGEVTFNEFIDIAKFIKIPKQTTYIDEKGVIRTVSKIKTDKGPRFDYVRERTIFDSKTRRTVAPKKEPVTIDFKEIANMGNKLTLKPSPTTTTTKPTTPSKDTFGMGEMKDLFGGGKTVTTTATKTEGLNLDYLIGTAAPKVKTTTIPKIKSITGDTAKVVIPVVKVGMDKNTAEFEKMSFGFGQPTKTTTKQVTKTITKPKEVDTFGFRSLSESLQRTQPTQKEISKQQLSQISKTTLATQQLFRPLQQTRTLQRTLQRTDPFKFKFPEFKFKEEKKKEEKKKSVKEGKEESIWDWGFVAEVRRGGKFKPVSKAVSKKEAFLIGEDLVKNTLGASFRVRKTKQKVKVKKKETGEFSWFGNSEFYKKQEKGEDIFIQKRGKRLSSKGERREIQKSRKKKSVWNLW